MSAMEELQRLYGIERDRLRREAERPTLEGSRLSPVFGEGSKQPKLVLVGEAPGANETLEGKPFAGRAGKQLDALLERAGISRCAIYLTNAVKFRPTRVKLQSVANRTPSADEIRAGMSLLREELRILSPRVVATLGNTPLAAVAALAGKSPMQVGDVHGRPMTIGIGGHAFELFPLYHPASALYNRALLPILEEDFLRLAAFIEGEE